MGDDAHEIKTASFLRKSCPRSVHEVLISPMPNEPEPPPIKYPPWVKKEILLPVFGVLLLGLIGGNFLVYRSIKKERRYSPVDYGPMDHRPSGANRPIRMSTATNAPTNNPAAPGSQLPGPSR